MANLITRIQQDLAAQGAQDRVLAATVAHPPGATLYKQYAGSVAESASLGGPIAEAIASKVAERDDTGEAARIPPKMGILAVTDRRLLWIRSKPSLGSPKPATVVAAWERGTVTLETDEGSWADYPSFLLGFADGTSVVVFTDRKAVARELAAAWGPGGS